MFEVCVCFFEEREDGFGSEEVLVVAGCRGVVSDDCFDAFDFIVELVQADEQFFDDWFVEERFAARGAGPLELRRSERVCGERVQGSGFPGRRALEGRADVLSLVLCPEVSALRGQVHRSDGPRLL